MVRRHLRPLAGVLPGTRIGRIRWPRRVPAAPFPWHYWWQAHLLDCLVDAQLRRPGRGGPPRSPRSPAASGCATAAPGPTASTTTSPGSASPSNGRARWRGGRPTGAGAVSGRLHARVDRGRRGRHLVAAAADDFKNAPANGPAAILLAREGQLEFAAAITDWMAETLVDPATGLIRDGVRLRPGRRIARGRRHDLHLLPGRAPRRVRGALRGGRAQRWAERAAELLDAVGGTSGRARRRGPRLRRRRRRRAVQRDPHPLPGRRRRCAAPSSRPPRGGSCWRARRRRGRGGRRSPGGRCSPRTGAARPRTPRPGLAEADLSVQLSAWMLLEAAAAVQRAG